MVEDRAGAATSTHPPLPASLAFPRLAPRPSALPIACCCVCVRVCLSLCVFAVFAACGQASHPPDVLHPPPLARRHHGQPDLTLENLYRSRCCHSPACLHSSAHAALRSPQHHVHHTRAVSAYIPSAIHSLPDESARDALRDAPSSERMRRRCHSTTTSTSSAPAHLACDAPSSPTRAPNAPA